jgi:hypothetical protein
MLLNIADRATMTNRIKEIRIDDIRLDPGEAEIWISVTPETLTSTTQVRGRLTGPRCPYATTVEVAYPFREQSRTYASEGTPRLILRIIIPEANFWDPVCPFLYHGFVELWQSGQRCEVREISHGLRALQLGPRGLRLNGRPLILRGMCRDDCSEAAARVLHDTGVNTLLVPAAGAIDRLWDIGDRFGLFLLGRISTKADLKQVPSIERRPSCLGWLVNPELFQDELSRIAIPTCLERYLWGIEVQRVPVELHMGASFVACPEELLSSLEGIGLPKIILSKSLPADSATAHPPDILGWIQEPLLSPSRARSAAE